MDEHRFDDDGGANHDDEDVIDPYLCPYCGANHDDEDVIDPYLCPYCGAGEEDDHEPSCPLADYPFDLEIDLEDE